MSKKYKLLDECIELNRHKLFRIQALKDFSNVKTGDIGGYIEYEKNLSQKGNCWVSGDAWIEDNAEIYGNSEVSGSAKVSGRAKIVGKA